jgi:hypothetical protein
MDVKMNFKIGDSPIKCEMNLGGSGAAPTPPESDAVIINGTMIPIFNGTMNNDVINGTAVLIEE